MYDFGIKQAFSGYRVSYRRDEPNYCPGCGQSHWIVGRLSVECAFCGTALPLHGGGASGCGTHKRDGVKVAA